MSMYCDTVDLSLFQGRWVRSDTKADNVEEYMKWLGMNDEFETAQETNEPQVQIITSFDKENMTLVHQLPWRSGQQIEYTCHFDGKNHPIPQELIKSGAVSGSAEWMHKFDEDGLVSEQKLTINGKSHTLRSCRTLESQNETKITYVCLPVVDGFPGPAVRYFNRIPFKGKWTAAAAQFFSGMDVAENLKTTVGWMRKAKEAGADLIVTPENSNRDRQYFVDGKPCKKKAYEMSEALDGDYVMGCQATAKELGIWACIGVDIKGQPPDTAYIAQVLIRPDGEIEGVNKKHVLWDYEYTLFEPGEEPFQVFDTELGRLGLFLCADGIVPEAARMMCLMGTQVFLNSLNSRGPDEMRMHIPLRSMENGVWHVASNCVGNPNTVGLLWPWTGGSQIVDPMGNRITASEEHDDMIVGEVRPFESELKKSSWTDDLIAQRRPELYGAMCKGLNDLPCATMYGPAPEVLPYPGPESLKVAMMQLSRVHTRECTEWMTTRQVAYAAKRGAKLGVLPQLWCFARGEVEQDPQAAADYSETVLKIMLDAAPKGNGLFVCFSLVERDGGKLYHTAYLIGPSGLVAKYRKAHLNSTERPWATPGAEFSQVHYVPELGRVAMMLGDEVWIPEVSRILALEGVEIIMHPTDWDRVEAAEMAATERASENKIHLVSVTRLDCPGKIGSQTTLAGEFIGDEPIPLMRFNTGVWCRYNVEEQVLVDLKRREPHCKMMGFHLDVLKKRFPHLYGVCVQPTGDLYTWRNTTKTRPGDYKDEHLPIRSSFSTKRKHDVYFPPQRPTANEGNTA